MFTILFALFQPTTINSQQSETQEVGFWEIFLQGGILMIPLSLLLILSIYFIVSKILIYRQINKELPQIKTQLVHFIDNKQIKQGDIFCKQNHHPLATICTSIFTLPKQTNLTTYKNNMEMEGKKQYLQLKKHLYLIATIAGASPLLGFMGTVTGMIRTFISIQTLQGSVNPNILAGGIWEALTTTAYGLAIGIIAYIGYNVLLEQSNQISHTLEGEALSVIDRLKSVL